ncbi:MAG: endonuclease domain-containing protein [Patescibacteria group bacterium]
MHSKQTVLRRHLRQSMPSAESIIWKHIRNRRLSGIKFRRQHSIGKFVVDFYCLEVKVAIEIDGGSHTASEVVETKDQDRQKFIESLGIKVLRYDNLSVYESLNNVLNDISENILSPSPQFPSPQPSPKGEGGIDI